MMNFHVVRASGHNKQVAKAGFQPASHFLLFLHQRIVITDSQPSGAQHLSLPIGTRCQTGSVFFFFLPSAHWFVLTSCVPSRRMCHYTARSDGRTAQRVLRYTREGEGWGSKRRPSLTEMNGRKSRQMMRRDLFWVTCSERCTQGCYLYTCQRNWLSSGSFILVLWMSPQSEYFPSTVDFF